MLIVGPEDEVAMEFCRDPACPLAEVPSATGHIHMVAVQVTVANFATQETDQVAELQVAELQALWAARVAELPDGQVQGELTEDYDHQTHYLLVCRECGDGDDALVMPFESPAARGKWAAGHTRGTGHDRWFVKDEPRQ